MCGGVLVCLYVGVGYVGVWGVWGVCVGGVWGVCVCVCYLRIINTFQKNDLIGANSE